MFVCEGINKGRTLDFNPAEEPREKDSLNKEAAFVIIFSFLSLISWESSESFFATLESSKFSLLNSWIVIPSLVRWMRSFMSFVGLKLEIRARNPSALRRVPTFSAIPACMASCKSLGQGKKDPF
ncbi:hypothetical protein RHOW815_000712 [Candidatus Rhabdochlamydia sp. W815]|nr:hypothetical protein RHOW815_000712 [Candidatus Rhabdochlamydia sp. W815]